VRAARTPSANDAHRPAPLRELQVPNQAEMGGGFVNRERERTEERPEVRGRRRAPTNGGRRGREERVRECSGSQPNGRREARAEPIERPMFQVCQIERSSA
jgi:hypothetical protein